MFVGYMASNRRPGMINWKEMKGSTSQYSSILKFLDLPTAEHLMLATWDHLLSKTQKIGIYKIVYLLCKFSGSYSGEHED
jgi:hypothetical protein